MAIPSLRRRRRRLLRGRKIQLARFRRTGKVGHRKRAGVLGRRARKVTALLGQALSVVPGPPAWGGSKQIIKEEVWPIVRGWQIKPTSGKRTETFGNPSSDHFVGNVYAFAKDYATASNFSLAQVIRTALDGGVHVDYENFLIERRGHTYRVQIIAGTHGTGPHLHIGVRRES